VDSSPLTCVSVIWTAVGTDIDDGQLRVIAVGLAVPAICKFCRDQIHQKFGNVSYVWFFDSGGVGLEC